MFLYLLQSLHILPASAQYPNCGQSKSYKAASWLADSYIQCSDWWRQAYHTPSSPHYFLVLLPLGCHGLGPQDPSVHQCYQGSHAIGCRNKELWILVNTQKDTLLSRPGSIILEHAWVTSHFEIPLLVNQSLRMFPPCVASYIHRRHQNPWHAEESRGQWKWGSKRRVLIIKDIV